VNVVNISSDTNRLAILFFADSTEVGIELLLERRVDEWLTELCAEYNVEVVFNE